MSYTSDVRIMTTEKGVAEIGAYIEKYAKKQDEPIFADETVLWNEKEVLSKIDGKVLLGWDDTKWTECYGSELIEEALQEMKEPYHFIRYGEGDGDKDEQASGEGWRFEIDTYRGFLNTTQNKTDVFFTDEQRKEIERAAKRLDKTPREVAEQLIGVWQANFYEDLKDIEKEME